MSFGTIQTATRPEVGGDGYFFRENVKTFDTFDAGVTTTAVVTLVNPSRGNIQ